MPKTTQTIIIIFLILIPVIASFIIGLPTMDQSFLEPPQEPDPTLDGFLNSFGPPWMLFATLILMFAEIPLVLFAWKTLNHEEVDFRAIANRSIQVLPMYILIGILFFSIFLLLSLAFVIPGILAAIYYAFAGQIVILEPETRGVRNIFNKSADLAKGNFRLIFILFAITVLLPSLNSFISEIPAQMISILFQSFTVTAAFYILVKEKASESTDVLTES